MIAVDTQLAAYRSAAAELPMRLRVREGAGEIAVVRADAAGLAAGVGAAERGARVVVIDRPGTDDGDLAALRATGVAIVLARHGLRTDDAAQSAASGAGAPAAICVQAIGARGALGGVLLDAVGWARVLAGGDLALRSAHRRATAALADLSGPGGGGIAVIASEMLGTFGVGRLRATAIALHRTDVVSSRGQTTVSRATPDGELVLPRRWESHERLALRRALAALAGEQNPTDAVDWAHDLALATAIVGSAPGTHQQH